LPFTNADDSCVALLEYQKDLGHLDLMLGIVIIDRTAHLVLDFLRRSAADTDIIFPSEAIFHSLMEPGSPSLGFLCFLNLIELLLWSILRINLF
jgi:hypothetical protein